eukprot:2170427-Pleurochrysis_carterae.AAC.2
MQVHTSAEHLRQEGVHGDRGKSTQSTKNNGIKQCENYSPGESVHLDGGRVENDGRVVNMASLARRV